MWPSVSKGVRRCLNGKPVNASRVTARSDTAFSVGTSSRCLWSSTGLESRRDDPQIIRGGNSLRGSGNWKRWASFLARSGGTRTEEPKTLRETEEYPQYIPAPTEEEGGAVSSEDMGRGHGPMRVSKRIARAGVASRREAEQMCLDGAVMVNGEKISSPALNVTMKDVVMVQGKVLSEQVERPRLWMCHKLPGELVSRSDPKDRQTLLQRVKHVGMSDRLKAVGRLDYWTEGLILLSNDGDLARLLEHPGSGIVRQYRVRVHGNVTKEKLRAIRNGPIIDGIKYKPMTCWMEETTNKNTWMVIECTEGKNRQVRKVCEYLKLTVNRLIRTSFGPFKLGKVKPGGVAEVPLYRSLVERMQRNMDLSAQEKKKEERERGRRRGGSKPLKGRSGVFGAVLSAGEEAIRRRGKALTTKELSRGHTSSRAGAAVTDPRWSKAAVARAATEARVLREAAEEDTVHRLKGQTSPAAAQAARTGEGRRGGGRGGGRGRGGGGGGRGG